MKLVFVSLPSKGCFIEHGGFSGKSFWSVETKVLHALARLHKDDPHTVFICPSLQNYTLLKFMPDVGATYEEWKERCRMLLARCDEVIVLCFESWDQSTGVRDEIAIAQELSIPVTYRQPHELTL